MGCESCDQPSFFLVLKNLFSFYIFICDPANYCNGAAATFFYQRTSKTEIIKTLQKQSYRNDDIIKATVYVIKKYSQGSNKEKWTYVYWGLFSLYMNIYYIKFIYYDEKNTLHMKLIFTINFNETSGG